MRHHWVFLGAICAGLAVAMGAFGAHGLDGFLTDKYGTDPELLDRRLDNWKTAALYQMHHALGLIGVGLLGLSRTNKWLDVAGFCFLIGIVLFSGLLYVLVVTDIRVLGAIVPIGGISFIVGWIALAVGGCCLSPNPIVKLNENP